MIADKEGFLYPEIDMEKCIHCGLCEKICPKDRKNLPTGSMGILGAYAAFSKDEEVRRNSSSGGVFWELAKYVIECGGVVFGAAFQKDMSIGHQVAETLQDVKRLTGSKYVQSDLGNCFHQVKTILEQGRMVLFTVWHLRRDSTGGCPAAFGKRSWSRR